MIVVLMGVTGSGKSTIGTLLARQTGSEFRDADDFHPPANKAKMAAGEPLTDEDRLPWLQTLNGILQRWAETGQDGVLACSALKAAYRGTLSSGMAPETVHFVHLDGSRELIESRLAARHHEFMSPKLLESQLNTLEAPADALRVCNDRGPEVVVQQIMSAFAKGRIDGT